METKAQNTTDIILPGQTLTRTEYASLLKKHYLRLLDSLDVNLKEALKGRDGFQLWDIPADYEPAKADSLHPKELEDFAIRIGMPSAKRPSEMLLSREKIDDFFDSYESEMLPVMKSWYGDNYIRNTVTEILSLEWDTDRRTAFSLGFLPEFKRMLKTGYVPRYEKLISNTHLYLRGNNRYPDGNIFFRIKSDDAEQEIKVHCDFKPSDPGRYKKVGYHGYDKDHDFYFIDNISVTGPMGICWDEQLKGTEDRLHSFIKETVRHIGEIRI